jgi:hypothetical protein
MRADSLRNLFRKHRSSTWGTSKSSKRTQHRLERSGEPPRGERIKQRLRGAAQESGLNCRLLFRFLVSRLGSPWDQVLSELARAIRSRRRQQVVLEAVRSFVEVSAREVKNSVCDSRGVPLPTKKRVGELRLDRCLYVCPCTGLLKQVPLGTGKGRGTRRCT